MTQDQPVKITLQGVEETLLLPLWVRACETRRAHPIIRDEKAVEMVDRIDYDFGVFDQGWPNAMITHTAIAVRTEILDRAVADFVERHPDGVIVNLGAGLDTRFHRVDNGRLRWFDVDLPRSIELRRRFLTESDRHRFITRSFLDPTWVEAVEADGAPVLVIAEGLFMYFEEAEVRGFLRGLGDRMPGAEVLIEALDPAMVAVMNLQGWANRLGVRFKWGLWAGRDLERWGRGIRCLAEWRPLDRHTLRLGPLALFTQLPPVRNSMKIVHLRVGETNGQAGYTG